MKPWATRRVATVLGVVGLFVLGGVGGSMLQPAPTIAEPAPAAPVHFGSFAAHDANPAVPLAALAQEATTAYEADTAESTIERLVFRDQMRRLWEDHITWTRLYIISAAADLPDLELTAQRLLRNQADIGDAVKPFYGEEAGAELTTLLQEHILGAADLLAAAKAGDETAAETASANWYANADAIAAFLSAANPEAWPLADLQAEMRMHLDVTLEEATARLSGDFAADIAAYDKVHDHILAFADVLSAGLMQQFPDRFA